MKKIAALLSVLVLSSILVSCAPPQSTADCKQDCDNAFLEDFIIWDGLLGAFYHKNKCYDKCE